jgi:hypothetical protein
MVMVAMVMVAMVMAANYDELMSLTGDPLARFIQVDSSTTCVYNESAQPVHVLSLMVLRIRIRVCFLKKYFQGIVIEARHIVIS